MISLTPLWKLLESRPRLVAVLGEWRQRLRGAFGTVQPLLRPTDQTAAAYPNPCPQGLPLQVVRHRDGRVVAVSTEGEGTRLELADGDEVLYALSLTEFRKGVATALALRTARTTIVDVAVVIDIGTWEPQPATSFPVCLVRATTRGTLRATVKELLHDATKPTIVLTPTRAHWDGDLEKWCRSHRALLAPLDEITGGGDTKILAAPAWDSYLNAFCQLAKATFPSNYSNKRPRRKRADRTAKIEAVRKELVQHIQGARDHAYSAKQMGREPRLLKRPTKSALARRAGIRPYDVTRCFQDDPQLRQLWEIADCLDDVMRFGRAPTRHRPA